jgi:hypothetical protein
MREAADDFHGKRVFFSARYLTEMDREEGK